MYIYIYSAVFGVSYIKRNEYIYSNIQYAVQYFTNTRRKVNQNAWKAMTDWSILTTIPLAIACNGIEVKFTIATKFTFLPASSRLGTKISPRQACRPVSNWPFRIVLTCYTHKPGQSESILSTAPTYLNQLEFISLTMPTLTSQSVFAFLTLTAGQTVEFL